MPSPDNKPAVGFDIKITGLYESDDASFTGVLYEPGPAGLGDGCVNWKGSCVAYSSRSLDVINARTSPLSSGLLAFISMTPYNTDHQEEVLKAAMELLQQVSLPKSQNAHLWPFSLPERPPPQLRYTSNDNVLQLMIECLSLKARNFYFKDRQPLGHHLADRSVADAYPYTDIEAIQNDYKDVFYQVGMHLLCRDLRNAAWLKHEFRSACQDKVQPFFDYLQMSDDPLPQRYRDALRRCYYAAYTCMRSSVWGEALSSARATFKNVGDTVHSDVFQVQWLPKFMDLEEQPGSQPFSEWLSIFRDKILLLKIIETGSVSSSYHPPEIDSIVDTLQTAAGQMGLQRVTLIEPSTRTIQLGGTRVLTGKLAKLVEGKVLPCMSKYE